jgi:hypothetical protein
MRHDDVSAGVAGGQAAARAGRRTAARAGQRAAAWATLVVAALSGCDAVTACPAVGYSASLTVELSESWAALRSPAVDVTCPDNPFCVPDRPVRDGDVWRAVVDSSPGHMVVTVTDGAVVVAEVPVEPTWRVVDHPYGRRCGGPAEAHVVLDLPE